MSLLCDKGINGIDVNDYYVEVADVDDVDVGNDADVDDVPSFTSYQLSVVQMNPNDSPSLT